MADDKKNEGHVASLFGSLTRLLHTNRQRSNHEALEEIAEAVEAESPVKVLNKEALRDSPRSGLRAQAIAQSSGTIKRPSHSQREPRRNTKRHKTEGNANVEHLGIASSTTHSSAQPEQDSGLEPQERPSTDQVRAGNESLHEIQSRSKSGRFLPIAPEFGSVNRPQTRGKLPDSLEKQPQHVTAKAEAQTGQQLPRPMPTAYHGNTRSKAKRQGGEETFDFNPDSSPEKIRTLPPVVQNPRKGRSQTKQNTGKKTTRGRPADVRGRAPEKSGAQDTAPKKRGQPQRSLEISGAPAQLQTSPPGRTEPQRRLRGRHPEEQIPSDLIDPISTDGEADADERPADENEAGENRNLGEHHDERDAERNSAVTTPVAINDSSIIVEPNPAFLGMDNAWNRVVEAAQKNRPDDDDEPFQSDAHGLTSSPAKEVHDLIQTIEKAKILYKSVIKGKNDAIAEQTKNDEFFNILEQLECQIKVIREFELGEDGKQAARSNRGLAIRYIYVRGVPDMVDLLDTAITCRSSLPPPSYSLQDVQEIVWLQNMTIQLCDTAVKWKAKPVDTDKPIIRNVRSIVFPILRDQIRMAFTNEMKRLSIIERKQRNREKTQARLESSAEEAQEDTNVQAERRQEELRLLAKDITRNKENCRAQQHWPAPRLKESRNSSLQPNRIGHQAQHPGAVWTHEEELELLIQLQKRGTRDLPAQQRYLIILNHPPLKNKLPEHIREKAMELEPYLLEVLNERGFVRSIEQQ